jgi:hypothetical protein
MKNKYLKNSCVICDNRLPSANHLSDLLETTVGTTYPHHILVRRVNLLTKKEKELCDKKWNKITKLFTNIDDIIANRAEKLNDAWK